MSEDDLRGLGQMSFKAWINTKKERFEMFIGWRQDSYPYELIEPRDHTVWTIPIFVLWLMISIIGVDTSVYPAVQLISAFGVAGWFHMSVCHNRLRNEYDEICKKLENAERER